MTDKSILLTIDKIIAKIFTHGKYKTSAERNVRRHYRMTATAAIAPVVMTSQQIHACGWADRNPQALLSSQAWLHSSPDGRSITDLFDPLLEARASDAIMYPRALTSLLVDHYEAGMSALASLNEHAGPDDVLNIFQSTDRFLGRFREMLPMTVTCLQASLDSYAQELMRQRSEALAQRNGIGAH
jgi:hypothetical protein